MKPLAVYVLLLGIALLNQSTNLLEERQQNYAQSESTCSDSSGRLTKDYSRFGGLAGFISTNDIISNKQYRQHTHSKSEKIITHHSVSESLVYSLLKDINGFVPSIEGQKSEYECVSVFTHTSSLIRIWECYDW